MVEQRLMANPTFALAARPKVLTPLILSRHRTAETYGPDADDTVMRGVRTDLSFALFLSDPETYDGGALVIEDTLESRSLKLGAGDLIVYPSTSVHRVDPVARGERLALVGWATSWVRRADHREILFDLERRLQHLEARSGAAETIELLNKTRSNLLRLWAD